MNNRLIGSIVVLSGLAIAVLTATVTWWILFDRVFTDRWMAEFGILPAMILAGFSTATVFAAIVATISIVVWPLLTPAERRALEVANERRRRGLPR